MFTAIPKLVRIYGFSTMEVASQLRRSLFTLPPHIRILAMAPLLWKKRPCANSSFGEFESIVAGIRSSAALKAEALSAIDKVIDSAHGPQAESSTLSERVSDTELVRRRAAVAAMRQHMPTLKQAGHAHITTFLDEIEEVLERRIMTA